MKRRLIWTVLVMVTILIGLGIGVWRNLDNNAYYYATHMPYRKDYYPVFRVVAVKPLPQSVNKVYPSNINYAIKNDNVDGLNGAINIDNVYKKGDYWSVDSDSLYYSLKFDSTSLKGMTAEFTSKMRLYDREGNGMKYDRSKMDNKLKDITQRIKKAVKKPKVNLQFLYNWIYM
ncbi:hypothetical protein [Pediococcus claussenii]|uniref:Uncharacterized protein n=1 Tax=Pediococcus claussenii (strain ATCC BAA-344 / DSM 14800 / JCM 18046 / KCTC 3811 / LMG 21948 / P06) TaxID=701521 RepID=G8PAD3_PEDCP|nr:hypothetical protein [Pediococcus claussenii]AEV94572.1 hypothetical protein PECL_249 [Pediococcus claussenii ATCC BAA-344]ANZ69785.1 hypothetical protein AYR57_05385 [Pediococcus claussenii]ANZ71602.1 hypothetical protein AYR58_05390 [Pediococcus claussenii]KRN19722.1 hypothetical protein IV79_GL001009 [Pediococcus claussenii]